MKYYRLYADDLMKDGIPSLIYGGELTSYANASATGPGLCCWIGIKRVSSIDSKINTGMAGRVS